MHNYLSAILAGVRPKRPTADAKRSPGIAIFDAGLDLRWTYEGTALGDYPPLEAVLAAVRSIATS